MSLHSEGALLESWPVTGCSEQDVRVFVSPYKQVLG
jgi:hypothetical protein